MFREKIEHLYQWTNKENRKPLIINGARQVGKSWLVREIGNKYFDGNIIEINFEKNLELNQIFKSNLEPSRIINEISLFTNKQIRAGKDLLFFDEIQMCPEALMSLRYFYEELPLLHIIAAGSLLDFSFRNISFPVGRVEFMELFPMNFMEYLIARERDSIVQLIKNDPANITVTIENLIYVELNNYFVVGGMPECVQLFCKTSDFLKVGELQNDLLFSFAQDFKKYKPQVNSYCLNDVLENTVKNIGGQTTYSKLSDRFSNPTIKQGLDVLITARILHKVENVGISGLPLTVSGKQFKTYFLDIGLLLKTSKINFKESYINKSMLSSFEGKLAEQFVFQQIISKQKEVKFWARTKSGSNAEVDFIILKNNEILPIEVKSGTKGALKSLHYLLENYDNIKSAHVYGKFKMGNINKINFLPIYMAGV
jgi:uncharacterized protein